MGWISKKARVLAESVLAVGAVVVGLNGGHHATLAFIVGAAFALIFLLDLFGRAAWNGLSGAVVKNAMDRGLLQPQDPEATERVRKLRTAFLHLLDELDDCKRLVEAAVASGEYWRPGFVPGTTHMQFQWWPQHESFIAEWPDLGDLYQTVSKAHRMLRRTITYASPDFRAGAREGRGTPVLPEDDLPAMLAAIEESEAKLREALKQLEPL